MGEKVWVVLERDEEGITDASVEALGFGEAWARESGASLEAVCVGGEAPFRGELPGQVSRVYWLRGDGIEKYSTRSFGRALEWFLSEHEPSLLVFPPSTQGEDLASWLGAGAGAGALLGVRELRIDQDRRVATRIEFDGKVAVDYELGGRPAVVTPEGGVAQRPSGPFGEPEMVVVEAPTREEVPSVRLVRSELAARTVDLRAARAIVGVGAGVGGKESFERAQELARLLGAEIGATRAAVDAGWVAHERQIGQTGVKVKPDLYVACGISGAAQHRVGMADSGTIVSVNIDSHAPIFRFSHFCVVGDAKAVLPKLVELLRR
jgi:electron transfer flavoprotein alpha subunit